MRIFGTIHFPNDLSEDKWNELVNHFDLKHTNAVKMLAPMTSEYVTVTDPPNLLALSKTDDRDSLGIIRSSRMFFDGGIGDTAEISFQGRGKKFESLVDSICDFVNGTLSIEDTVE